MRGSGGGFCGIFPNLAELLRDIAQYQLRLPQCSAERLGLPAVCTMEPCFVYLFFEEDFFRGTVAPSLRASDKPIAIACFLLVTFFPERPLFNVPCFLSCIAFSTFFDAFFPYLAIY